MSDQDPSTPPAPATEQDWPQTCPECGTRLQPVAVAFAADSPEQVGATADVAEAVFEDRCPDPSCPVNQASEADRAGGDDEAVAGGSTLGDRQPDRPTLPGSLGGDNGGA